MNQTWQVTDDLTSLLAVLPPFLVECLKSENNLNNLIEIVLDLGRQPEARFTDGYRYLKEEGISRDDLEYVLKRVGRFGPDNRAGIERTLHRISALRNRKGDIIGLTCRVGRAVFGTVEPLRDVIERGKSILLLGRPGVGKTTMLRELARILSVEFRKRVVIVDTSNEIAGDGDIPHPAIGLARRMQVPSPERQHDVMIEAVENHMPEIIIIDEIGTVQEAQAARTIAERGVQLIGTAHGNSLENLILNPTLTDLVGGIQAVTLGDEEAKRRGTQKTVLERKAPPAFETIVEIREKDTFAIHHDAAQVVDSILRNLEPKPEIRIRTSSGQYEIVQESNLGGLEQGELEPTVTSVRKNGTKTMGIFPYAVNRNRLEKAIRSLQVSAQIAKELNEADLVVTIKAQARKAPQKIKEAERRGLPIYVIKSNTVAQLEHMLIDLFGNAAQKHSAAALQEAEEAIRKVRAGEEEVELTAQSSPVRKLQHQLASRYNCFSESWGEEPNRRVVIRAR